MEFKSGLDKHKERQGVPLLSTGDAVVDKLLGGGVEPEVVYLFYGDKQVTGNLLYGIIVSVLSRYKTSSEGQVVYADAYNRFNPYTLSKMIAAKGMSPTESLDSILISRAFTWEQMVELLENRAVKVENMKLFIISGLTYLFPNHEMKSFQQLQKALSGVKKVLAKHKPIIVLTGPKHVRSLFRPEGGKILSHFGHVQVLIEDFERKTEYSLIQHPTRAPQTKKRFKPRKPKRRFKKEEHKHFKLDAWL